MNKPSPKAQQSIRHSCRLFGIPLVDDPSAGQWQAAAIKASLVGQVMTSAGSPQWDAIRREAALDGASLLTEHLEDYGYRIVTEAEWLRMESLDDAIAAVSARASA